MDCGIWGAIYLCVLFLSDIWDFTAFFTRREDRKQRCIKTRSCNERHFLIFDGDFQRKAIENKNLAKEVEETYTAPRLPQELPSKMRFIPHLGRFRKAFPTLMTVGAFEPRLPSPSMDDALLQIFSSTGWKRVAGSYVLDIT